MPGCGILRHSGWHEPLSTFKTILLKKKYMYALLNYFIISVKAVSQLECKLSHFLYF